MAITVYPLWHVRKDDEYGDNAKFIGIYSSEAAANEAIARLSDKPGFRDYPASFHVDPYQIDQDHWIEGFGFADDQ